MEFKDRLRAERIARDLTQKETAALVQCSHRTIGNLEMGHEPRRPLYEKLLDVFPALRDREPVSQ